MPRAYITSRGRTGISLGWIGTLVALPIIGAAAIARAVQKANQRQVTTPTGIHQPEQPAGEWAGHRGLRGKLPSPWRRGAP